MKLHIKYITILVLASVCVSFAQNGYNQGTVAGTGTAINPNMAGTTAGGGSVYSTTPPTTYSSGLRQTPPMTTLDNSRHYKVMVPYNNSVSPYYTDYDYLYNANQDYTTRNPVLLPQNPPVPSSTTTSGLATGRPPMTFGGNEYYRYKDDATLLLEAQRRTQQYGRPQTGISDDLARLMRIHYYLEPVTQTPEQKREFLKNYNRELDKIKYENDDPRQDLMVKNLTVEESLRYNQSQSLQKLREQVELAKKDQQPEDDLYTQMKKKIEQFQTSYEEIAKQQESEQEKEEPNDTAAAKKIAREKLLEERRAAANNNTSAPKVDKKSEAVQMDSQEYASLALNREDIFNQYMKQAEKSMQEKKYYEAADYYTLASIFKEFDPLAYAGRGYALFAAGEYMSSSMYIAKALELFPEYLQFKVNVAQIIGDKDLIENRLVDLKAITDRSEIPELQFLIAYISYRLDNMEQAKKYANRALGKMPDLRAVLVLNEAVGNK